MEMTWPEAIVWVAVILVLGPIVVPLVVSLLAGALLAVCAAVVAPILWIVDHVDSWRRRKRFERRRREGHA